MKSINTYVSTAKSDALTVIPALQDAFSKLSI